MSIRWIFNTYSLLPEIFAGILETQLDIINTEIKTDLTERDLNSKPTS